ncbi:hypothetical protein K2173_026772 [Erythroxylum novogranatense]|uniref:Uncharacterized protein n=1 Tax=Erythroxylum novogranatense TaxID=1862640 RepID=A0AAV8TX92_9ROSI|nr:hypothetical protein K2173_026772 [Erythroxylum novogranatense]
MICDGNTIRAPPSANLAGHNPMEGIETPEAPSPREANALLPPVVSTNVSTLEPSVQEAQAVSCSDVDIAQVDPTDALLEDSTGGVLVELTARCSLQWQFRREGEESLILEGLKP